jgi:hypothetical protein
MTIARVRITASSILAIAMMAFACAELGFTNRVLHRVRSPDGQLFAVCQEIPQFDGPGYDVRLERADGSLVVRLYQIGDGDPCHEVAWSPDGRLLAVLSAHVARIRFVDVRKALSERSTTARWFWPQIDLGREGEFTFARDLRFSTPTDVELTTCPYDLRETQRARGRIRCFGGETRRRFSAPL